MVDIAYLCAKWQSLNHQKRSRTRKQTNKVVVTTRVDADVLAWLKEQGSGYQTRINTLLREAMERSKR